MQVDVHELEFDDGNEDEMWRHRVRAVEVNQVLDNEPVFFPNKAAHAARIVMIGPTFGGRLLTVPLAETPVPGLWRPATAFESSAGERARYRAATGG